MPNKLWGGKNRDVSHKKLADILAAGTHPFASCRENPNDSNEPYTVWDGPDDPNIRPPEPPVPKPMSEDEMLDRLAAKLMERILKVKV